MGNQINKRYYPGTIHKINKNNNQTLIDNSNPDDPKNKPIYDLTLRNTIWQIINDQKDYDTMEPFNVGTISPKMPIDTYIKMQASQIDKTGNIVPNPDMVTLPIYTPNPSIRKPDRASSHHFNNGRIDRDVYVNQFKGFCTYSVDKNLPDQHENVVSYPLPVISSKYLQNRTSNNIIASPDEKYDESSTDKFPIQIPNIGFEVVDRLKQIQDIATKYGISLVLDGSDIKNKKYKTADQLLSELNRNAYPQILDKIDIGYQMDYDDYTGYLNNNNTKNIQTKADSSTNNTRCDNFMIHQCAKQLYEQGCLKYDITYDNEGNPQRQAITWSSVNSMCYDKQNFPFTGASECVCINNPAGHAVNLFATAFKEDGTIPYTEKVNQGHLINERPIFCGTQPGQIDANDNVALLACSANRDNISDIILPLYNSDKTLITTAINPQLIPGNCNTAFGVHITSNGSGACYRTNTQQNGHLSVTTCSNTINIGNSNIDTLALEAIHMQNKCGQTSNASGDGITQTAEQKTEAEAEAKAIQAIYDNATMINIKFNNYATQIKNAPGKIRDYTQDYIIKKKEIETKISNANDIIKSSENNTSVKINDSIILIQNIQSQIDNILSALQTILNDSDINLTNIPSTADINNSYALLQQYLKKSLDKTQKIISNINKDNIIAYYAKITAYEAAIKSTLNDKIQNFSTIKSDIITINNDYKTLKGLYGSTGNYGDTGYTSDIIHKIINIYNKVALKEKIDTKDNPVHKPSSIGDGTNTNVPDNKESPSNVPDNKESPSNVPDNKESPSKFKLWLIIGVILLLIIIVIIIIIIIKNKSNNLVNKIDDTDTDDSDNNKD
jgi:hypothetical protein